MLLLLWQLLQTRWVHVHTKVFHADVLLAVTSGCMFNFSKLLFCKCLPDKDFSVCCNSRKRQLSSRCYSRQGDRCQVNFCSRAVY